MGKRKRAIAIRREERSVHDNATPIGGLATQRAFWGLVETSAGATDERACTLTRRGVVVTLLGLTTLSLIVRVLFYLAHANGELVTVPILDAAAYLTWAQEILDGVTRPLGAFFTEPGYAYLITLSLTFFTSYLPVLWLQLALGSTIPAISFLTARRLFNRDTPALIAGILMAFLRPAIFHDAVLLKTSLELWLSSLFIMVLVYVWHSRSAWQFFLLGILAGITALIKANVLYVVPLLVLALWVPKPESVRKTCIAGAALVVGTLLAISPATVYNYRATGTFIPVNYSGGVTVYIGNWEMADGSFMVPEYFSLDPVHEEVSWHALAEAFSGSDLNAKETSSFWLREGLREAVANPGHTISVTFKKIYLLVAGVEIADNYPVSFGEIHFPLLKVLVPFWFVSLLGLTGILLYTRKERKYELHLYAFAVGFSGLIVISKVAERYRLALATVFVLFAGYALHRLWCMWRERRSRAGAIAFTTLLFLLGMFLVAVRPVTLSTEHADLYLSFGSQYLDQEDTGNAKKMFEAGIALSPLHEPLLQQYGKTLLLEGDVMKALEVYRDALRARPDASTKGLEIAYLCTQEGCTSESVRAKLDALTEKQNDWSYQKEYLEGMRAFRRGDSVMAIELFKKAYEVNPKIRGLKSNIALLYGKEGKQEEAQTYLREAIVENSFDVVALYNLGNAYSRAGDYKQALPYYVRVQELVPDFNLARYNVARSYLNTGEAWKAREEFQTFIAYAEEHNLYQKETERAKQAVGQIENNLIQGVLPVGEKAP